MMHLKIKFAAVGAIALAIGIVFAGGAAALTLPTGTATNLVQVGGTNPSPSFVSVISKWNNDQRTQFETVLTGLMQKLQSIISEMQSSGFAVPNFAGINSSYVPIGTTNLTTGVKTTSSAISLTNNSESTTNSLCAIDGETWSSAKPCCAGTVKTYVDTTRVPANCNPEQGVACTSVTDNYICKGSGAAAACVAENGTITDNNGTCCAGLTKTYVSQTRVPAGCGPTTDNGNGLTCTSVTSNYVCKKPVTTSTGTTAVCATAGEIFKPGTKNCCKGLTTITAVNGCAGINATTEAAVAACFQNTTYTCKAATTSSTSSWTTSGTQNSNTTACVAENGTITDNNGTCCAGLTKTYVSQTRVPAGCGPTTDNGNGLTCTSVTSNYVCKTSTTATNATCAGLNADITGTGKTCCAGLTPTRVNVNGTIFTKTYCKYPTVSGTSITLPCAAANETFKPGTKTCCNGTKIVIAVNGCTGGETTEAARYACFQNTTYKCQ